MYTSYVAPTLLDFGSDSEAFHNSASMSAEIFGPLMPLLRVSSVDQVIASILTRCAGVVWLFIDVPAARRGGRSGG